MNVDFVHVAKISYSVLPSFVSVASPLPFPAYLHFHAKQYGGELMKERNTSSDLNSMEEKMQTSAEAASSLTFCWRLRI